MNYGNRQEKPAAKAAETKPEPTPTEPAGEPKAATEPTPADPASESTAGDQAPQTDGQSATPDKESTADDSVAALWIEALSDQGRWRCGFQFNRDGVALALDDLTDEQVAALKADPMLRVQAMADRCDSQTVAGGLDGE